MGEEQSNGRHVHLSCRLLMLLGVAALVVTLVGLAMTAIEAYFMPGLESNVAQLQATNQALKMDNQKFEQNNKDLQAQINNLTAINNQLNQQVVQFNETNRKMEKVLVSLNATDANLQQQVSNLKDLTTDLSDTVTNLRNKTESLEADVSSLEATSEKLNSTLSELEKLRDGLQQYDKNQKDDFEKAMAATLKHFHSLTNMVFQTYQSFCDDAILDMEYLDGGENYDPHEYSVFLNTIANVTSYTAKQLEDMYPYDVEKGQDVQMTYADILAVSNKIIQKEKARWEGNSTMSVNFYLDRYAQNDMVMGDQQERFIAEFRKLLVHI